MPTSVFARRHPLLDGRHPEAQLYLQHRDGRWGCYVRTVRRTAMVTFPGGTEWTYWDRNAICASVVTPRKIW